MVLSKVPSYTNAAELGNAAQRHVLVAIDLSDKSLEALNYYAHELAKPGDLVHLTHVSRCLEPVTTIQHSFPGSTYTVPELHPLDERKHTEAIQGVIQSRFLPVLDKFKIKHAVHLFLDTENSPSTAVSEILNRVAGEVGVSCLVMAAHNKAYGLHEFLLGSVANECMLHSKYPVIVVRNYRVPSGPIGGASD